MGWTCPECGIDYDTITPANAGVSLDGDAGAIRATVLAAGADAVRRRPGAGVWSAIEYTMHTGEVVDVLADTVAAIAEGRPVPEQWDPDERAEAHSYRDRDIEEAVQVLGAAVTKAGHTFAAIDEVGWTRTAEFPFGERDALTMARNAVHETHHHLLDVRRALDPA